MERLVERTARFEHDDMDASCVSDDAICEDSREDGGKEPAQRNESTRDKSVGGGTPANPTPPPPLSSTSSFLLSPVSAADTPPSAATTAPSGLAGPTIHGTRRDAPLAFTAHGRVDDNAGDGLAALAMASSPSSPSSLLFSESLGRSSPKFLIRRLSCSPAVSTDRCADGGGAFGLAAGEKQGGHERARDCPVEAAAAAAAAAEEETEKRHGARSVMSSPPSPQLKLPSAHLTATEKRLRCRRLQRDYPPGVADGDGSAGEQTQRASALLASAAECDATSPLSPMACFGMRDAGSVRSPPPPPAPSSSSSSPLSTPTSWLFARPRRVSRGNADTDAARSRKGASARRMPPILEASDSMPEERREGADGAGGDWDDVAAPVAAPQMRGGSRGEAERRRRQRRRQHALSTIRAALLVLLFVAVALRLLHCISAALFARRSLRVSAPPPLSSLQYGHGYGRPT